MNASVIFWVKYFDETSYFAGPTAFDLRKRISLHLEGNDPTHDHKKQQQQQQQQQQQKQQQQPPPPPQQQQQKQLYPVDISSHTRSK
jgi:hypothetical protein